MPSVQQTSDAGLAHGQGPERSRTPRKAHPSVLWPLVRRHGRQTLPVTFHHAACFAGSTGHASTSSSRGRRSESRVVCATTRGACTIPTGLRTSKSWSARGPMSRRGNVKSLTQPTYSVDASCLRLWHHRERRTRITQDRDVTRRAAVQVLGTSLTFEEDECAPRMAHVYIWRRPAERRHPVAASG